MPRLDRSAVAATELLSELVYELLDAHADTLALAADPGSELHWLAHLEYLRSLQRVGRETLARLPPADSAP